MTAPQVQVIQIPFLICPAVQLSTVAVLITEGDQAREEAA